MDMMFLAEAQGNPLMSYGMIGFWVLIIAAMYFFLWSPQQKKQKEEDALRDSVEIGDDVTTIGGIVGKIIAVREDDETVVIETGSDKTRIRFKKWAIRSIDTPEKQPKKEDKKSKKSKDRSENEEKVNLKKKEE